VFLIKDFLWLRKDAGALTKILPKLFLTMKVRNRIGAAWCTKL